jgi:hypothetical protein
MDHVPLEPVRRVAVPQTSGMATTSLVLGISSFFCWIFTGLPALILGIVALRNINRSNGQLKGDGLAIAGIVTGAVSSLMILPIMVALLLPAVQAAREAARRSVSLNNMKQISLALLTHETLQKTFPPAGGGAEEGSQLSWRVHILPYLGEQDLYEQFHLDEPWDSEHNRALFARMPAVFKDPNLRLPQGETSYLAVTGPGTAFGDGTAAPSIRDFTDGLSTTIMFVEANPDQAVVWTKPADWKFNPDNPTNGLGKARLGGFLAAFADGSTDFIQNQSDPVKVRALMTRDGDEQPDGFSGSAARTRSAHARARGGGPSGDSGGPSGSGPTDRSRARGRARHTRASSDARLR